MALVKVGAIWLKEKNGKKYGSGVLELEGQDGPKVSILMYKNENKKSDKEPDYRLMRPVDDEAPAQPSHSSDDDVPF